MNSLVRQSIAKFVRENIEILFVSFVAQGPLMITGPGMGMYPTPSFGAGAMYPPYGGAPGGYPGY